ncbi:MAG: DUF4276 family protein [Chitinophagales bacterium]
MTRGISIGLLTEGDTDMRFFKSIVERTFKQIRYECKKQIDIYEIEEISNAKGTVSKAAILEAAKETQKQGLMVLCVHIDADNKSDFAAFENKINPALVELKKKNKVKYCHILLPIVPIQETESWMLADKELLKNYLHTKKTYKELGIDAKPENITNPKEKIKNAIRKAKEHQTKRKRKSRRNLDISDLYQIIGTNLALEKLEPLSSYQTFKENVRKVFRELNFLH